LVESRISLRNSFRLKRAMWQFVCKPKTYLCCDSPTIRTKPYSHRRPVKNLSRVDSRLFQRLAVGFDFCVRTTACLSEGSRLVRKGPCGRSGKFVSSILGNMVVPWWLNLVLTAASIAAVSMVEPTMFIGFTLLYLQRSVHAHIHANDSAPNNYGCLQRKFEFARSLSL
jgi:hypothetical protein